MTRDFMFYMIIFFILMTRMFDQVMILCREIRSLSLLRDICGVCVLTFLFRD